jgi:hypothetical protein
MPDAPLPKTLLQFVGADLNDTLKASGRGNFGLSALP